MTLAPADVTAIVGGQHGDPFAVLGPHRVEARGLSAIAVRAFLPGATVAQVAPHHGQPHHLVLTLPPLGKVVFKPSGGWGGRSAALPWPR